MSEHQIVAFRAIDGPVNAKNLEYMRKQSSRAEITPWSFDNEYHYSDFRGNAEEMLRRGYDLHLHYANFGTRILMLRLPHGFPDPAAAALYLDKDGLRFSKDPTGPGGILSIDPAHEPGDLEEIWDFDEVLEQLLPLRAEIMNGDLRPLYLAQLAIAGDFNHDPEETTEGPVPAGLSKPTDAQRALMDLYDLSDYLIEAAAKDSPPLPVADDPAAQYTAWLNGQPTAKKNEWLAQWMADSNSKVRREILADFGEAVSMPTWPTMQSGRTLSDLQKLEEESYQRAMQKEAKAAERVRAKKLAGIAANPATTIQEVERLITEGARGYHIELAKLLADLRDALRETPQTGLAEEHALRLKDKYPTRKGLITELRNHNLLPQRWSR